MICFFFLWKLSECNWFRKLKLSQNKVVVFSLSYYSLHRKSNQLKIGWAILCDARKMTDTISIINGHMFCFNVSYRDCVEWLLFEIDMSSSSAPQFSFLFVKYSLVFFGLLSLSRFHMWMQSMYFRHTLSLYYGQISHVGITFARITLIFAIKPRFKRNQQRLQQRHNQFNDRSIRVVLICWYFVLRLFHLLLLLLLLYRDRTLRWINRIL